MNNNSNELEFCDNVGTSSLLSACNKEGIPYQVVLATSFLKLARSFKGLKGEILDEFAFSWY